MIKKHASKPTRTETGAFGAFVPVDDVPADMVIGGVDHYLLAVPMARPVIRDAVVREGWPALERAAEAARAGGAPLAVPAPLEVAYDAELAAAEAAANQAESIADEEDEGEEDVVCVAG